MYLGNVHTPTSHCNLVLHTYHPFPCPPSSQSPIDGLSISSSFIVSLELSATCHSPPNLPLSALRLTLIHFLIYLCTMHSSILLLFIFCWNLNPSNLHKLLLHQCQHLSNSTIQPLITWIVQFLSTWESFSLLPLSGSFLQVLGIHSSSSMAQVVPPPTCLFFFSICNRPIQFFLYPSLLSCLSQCYWTVMHLLFIPFLTFCHPNLSLFLLSPIVLLSCPDTYHSHSSTLPILNPHTSCPSAIY